ncbi:MAG: response regulator [Deltaproteobacteria bacterium]
MAKKKILFVDDEVDFLKMVKLNLEATGAYEVRTESKGLNALTAVRQFRPDVIFLDVVMPDLDGGEVLEQLKVEPELKNIPVVFLTAIVTEKEVSNHGQIAGRSFIAKPISTAKLIDCITSTLGG